MVTAMPVRKIRHQPQTYAEHSSRFPRRAREGGKIMVIASRGFVRTEVYQPKTTRLTNLGALGYRRTILQFCLDTL